jgi:hypothetical protein
MAHDEIRKPLRIFISQTNKQLMVMAADESKRNTKRQANC